MHTLQAILAVIGMGVVTTYAHAIISGYNLYPKPRAAWLTYYGFVCLPGIAVSLIAQYFLI